MNLTRLGFASLIVGLILIFNSSSSHVSGIKTRSFGALDENQAQTYLVMMASVGPANLGIGLQTSRPEGLPEGLSDSDYSDVIVHVKFVDPNNKTIIEENIVTPYTFDVNFKTRGIYTVYVTNKGAEKTNMPLSIIFDLHNPQNKDADKFLLSIVLTVVGAILVVVGVIMNLIMKHTQRKSEVNLMSSNRSILPAPR